MQNQINQADSDRIEIIGRKRLAMSGVEAVDGFSEQTLDLTVSGIKVRISGEKIKITSFNKAAGTLGADGVFNEIKYHAKKTPFIKRLFR